MKILFTSVGRRVELVQAFKNAAKKTNTNLTVYGADISHTAPALSFCDKCLDICRIDDKSYIPLLLDICKKNEIDALFPTIDTDLLILSKNKELFENIGTKVFVSSPDKIEICRDKRHTSDFFVKCGLKAPMPVDNYAEYEMGYPAFIKPKDGSSSINAFKVRDFNDLKTKAMTISDYIVQPYIDGKEFTVDIFCDYNGNPIYITPRERLVVRAGEVLKTRIVQDDLIIKESMSIIEKFKPCGPITVQLIRENATGDDYYIEINPRFGGGAPLSIKAGADSAEAALNIIGGKNCVYIPKVAENNAVYSRFDQSVCVQGNSFHNIKAVIFDLDDTLYSEKEYVKSGFKAIEYETGIPADEFYEAFEKGIPAIDSVLNKKGMISLKNKCLDKYRSHKPDIHLYKGAKALISNLKERGFFVGIITDGRPEGQRAKIEALQLDVDKIIITDEIGGEAFRKPCDIAFRIMKQFANVDYSQMVYIADNLSKDFIAPKQLGIKTIWFDNEDGIYKFDTKEKITKINSINQLNDILDFADKQ